MMDETAPAPLDSTRGANMEVSEETRMRIHDALVFEKEHKTRESIGVFIDNIENFLKTSLAEAMGEAIDEVWNE